MNDVLNPGSPFSLDGRKALVTGGNRGIGRAIAEALALAGAEVVIAARNEERNADAVRDAAQRGITLNAIAVDITEPGGAARAVDSAADVLEGLDVLVNNAGDCVHAPALEVEDDDWRRVFDLNVDALWHCSCAAVPHLRARGGGAIVNIGSISAMIVNRPQWQPAYNASKAAVHQLTRSLAAEWVGYGIRVNALAPGYVATEMAPVDRPEFRRHWIDDTPMGRAAAPEEIAPSVVFLASAAASYITGTVLVADGGYTLW